MCKKDTQIPGSKRPITRAIAEKDADTGQKGDS